MANALFPAYADDLACQKFISSDSLFQLLLAASFCPSKSMDFTWSEFRNKYPFDVIK